jgi:hypothetical protein
VLASLRIQLAIQIARSHGSRKDVGPDGGEGRAVGVIRWRTAAPVRGDITLGRKVSGAGRIDPIEPPTSRNPSQQRSYLAGGANWKTGGRCLLNCVSFRAGCARAHCSGIRRRPRGRAATPRGTGDRARFSCQMQGEVIRKIINVSDRQPCTYLGHVDECAPFENVIRSSFDPSWLIDGSPKQQTPIKEMCAHRW